MIAADQDIIRTAENYDMSRVTARYAAENDVSPAAASEHERELKRYLILNVLHPSKHYGMVSGIDELWHTFIIHTKEYIEFCDMIAGRYLHHAPVDPSRNSSEEAKKAELELYSEFLERYKLTFDEEAPRHIWPDLAEMRSRNDLRACDCRVCVVVCRHPCTI